VADAAAAAGVATAGGVILATGGWYWLDPAVALAIAVVVAYHALTLIREVIGRLRPAAADGSG
jgi:cobalt-zinc-cadmium efflux system protein